MKCNMSVYLHSTGIVTLLVHSPYFNNFQLICIVDKCTSPALTTHLILTHLLVQVCLKCCTSIALLKRVKDCTPSILHWVLLIQSDFEAYLKCCTSSTLLNRFYPVSISWHLWRSPEEVWSAKCKWHGKWVQEVRTGEVQQKVNRSLL